MDRSIGGSGGGRRGRETAHELARYEALFAARTRGMKSSAMREMMALTERPDVISLAGGLPDTSTFAPELYAKLMSQVAAESTARALQYGPTEGMAVTVDCIVEVMAAEGTVDRPGERDRHDRRPAGDRPRLQGADRPGRRDRRRGADLPGGGADVRRLSGRRRADRDGRRRDADRRAGEHGSTASQGEGRRPKFIYTIPNFQNPGGVTMSLPRRRRLVEVARERELLVLEDNPYGLLRYEGEPLPTLYSLDASLSARGGGSARDGVASDLVIYLGTFSKILSPGLRLGWAVAPRAVLEKLNLGKQGADLCSSPMTQLFVAAYFAERAADGRPGLDRVRRAPADLYRRRRDVMLESLQEHFGGRASWTRPEGGLFIWATLDGVDTTDLMGRSKGVAFVPGRSAYMDVDGRSGANSMRLNFAGVPDEDIREGIRRISAIAGPDTGLMGTLTGSSAAGTPGGAGSGATRARRRGSDATAQSRDVREATRAGRGAGTGWPTWSSCRGARRRTPPARRRVAARIDERRRQEGRGPQGRGLAGAHRLAALGRAGAERAAPARPRGRGDRRRARPRGAAAGGPARRGVHRAARQRRRGRDRAGALGGDRRPLHRLRAGGVHALHGQGAGEVPDARGGHSHARVRARSRRARSKSSASRRRCRGWSGASAFRSSPSRPARARRWA